MIDPLTDQTLRTISARDYARLAKVSVKTIRRHYKLNLLPQAVRVGRGLRWPLADVLRHLGLTPAGGAAA